MVNRWIDDEWSGPNGAHADLLDAGLADLCTLRPKNGTAVPNCQGYVGFDQLTASRLGIDITKDQALVRLLKGTLTAAPKNGDVLEFEDLTVTVSVRLSSDEDSWTFVCQM